MAEFQQVVVAPHNITQRHSPFQCVAQFILNVITAPYRRAFKLYTWQPIKNISKASGDRKLLISLIKGWRSEKYAEIQSVQVAASFCGGAAFTGLSWSRSKDVLWTADALWFASLICSIFAIITSIQTKCVLDDLPSNDQLDQSLPDMEVQRMQRTILRYKKTPGLKHWIMLFIWQFPSMTMSYAWFAFIIGLTVYVCTPFFKGLPWQDQHKVAIVYLAVGLISLITYISSTIFVYTGEKDYERCTASSHAIPTTRTSSSLNDPEAESNVFQPNNRTKSKGITDNTNTGPAGDFVQRMKKEVTFGLEHSD